jgi:hypothetical protein
MDQIELPFLPGNTGLDEAIELLRSSGHHALVTERDGSHFVLRSVDVLERWNALADAAQHPEAAELGQVVPRARPAAPPDKVAGFDNVPFDAVQTAAMETIFDQNDARYAVRSVLADTAKVITASENFARTLRGQDPIQGALSTILCCVGNPVHFWESFQLRDPARCNKPHGVPIVGR